MPDRLNFHDPRSIELLRYTDRVARSDATVLIRGETGSGKELLARHVHQASGRKGPFIAVNCGALVETLAEAELFGHEAGAFTGAGPARAGWFEAAQGGTLFLDEIGDMPLALQVKLLRVMQERQVVRLGARRPLNLNVRLVAATHVDLARAIEEEAFRADLYYRLNVVALDLPPLRERRGDIVPLARHFIELHAHRLGVRESARLSPQAEALLLAHPWPGNIRELENAIQLALISGAGATLQAEDFQLAEPWPAGDAEAGDADDDTRPSSGTVIPAASGNELAPLHDLLHDLLAAETPNLFNSIEETVVRAVYAHCAENQVHTARKLGISRNTLRTLLKRFGLRTEAADVAA